MMSISRLWTEQRNRW